MKIKFVRKTVLAFILYSANVTKSSRNIWYKASAVCVVATYKLMDNILNQLNFLTQKSVIQLRSIHRNRFWIVTTKFMTNNFFGTVTANIVVRKSLAVKIGKYNFKCGAKFLVHSP